MEKVIAPISPEILEKELLPHFIRNTNKGGNKIYICSHHNAPSVMKEIGRLRELSFRAAGGGTGASLDLDSYDTNDKIYYKQLVVYNPIDRAIVGGYRFMDCSNAINSDQTQVAISTSDYFDCSAVFIRNFLPRTIELGRSWIQPAYQSSTNRRKSIFALDNLWDGLGALIVDNEHIEFFFGKVTMYKTYPQKAKNLILGFLKTFFHDYENLVHPIDKLKIDIDVKAAEDLFCGKDYDDAYKLLNKKVRGLGVTIPPLVNAYMNLSPTMKTFGSIENNHFGSVEETAIMICINDIYPSKKKRHIQSYLQELKERCN